MGQGSHDLLPKLALTSWTALVLLSTACGSTPIQEGDDDGTSPPSATQPAPGGGGAPGNDSGAGDDTNLGDDPGPSSTSSTTGSSATSGQGGGPSGAGGGSGSGNDCCAEHPTAGCVDATVEACVCAIDNYCCDTAWDAACVDVSDANCGTACGDPGAGGGPNNPSSGSGPSGGGPTGGGSNPPSGCEQCILDQCGLQCILDGTCPQGLDLLVFDCLVYTCSQVCWGWSPPGGP